MDYPLKWNDFYSDNTSHDGSSVKSTSQSKLILTAVHMLIGAAEGE